MMPQYFGGPYRLRTWLRSNSPWFLIDLGFADKGADCELAGGVHEWHNIDNKMSVKNNGDGFIYVVLNK